MNQTGASGFRDDFSYAYFRRLVAAMKGQYRPCLFGEAPARLGREGRPLLFLRHDVDVSLERALEMARVEQGVGIAATYMVLAKAALYDYRSAPNARLVRELRRCGHEVGLHFDIEAEGVTQDAPAEEIERVLVSARDGLAEVLGESVPSFSFHRPIPRFLRGPLVIAEMVNGYAAELMAEYISDSKAHWREGEPLPRFSGKPKAEIFQVLVHPIWWGEKQQSGAERLQSFSEEQTVARRRMPRRPMPMFWRVLCRRLHVREPMPFRTRSRMFARDSSSTPLQYLNRDIAMADQQLADYLFWMLLVR